MPEVHQYKDKPAIEEKPTTEEEVKKEKFSVEILKGEDKFTVKILIFVEDRKGLRYSVVYKVEIPSININEDLIEEAVRNALKKFHPRLEESSQKLVGYLIAIKSTQEPRVEIEGKERGELSGTILPSVIDQQFIEDVMERVEESKILKPESKKEIKSLLARLSGVESFSPEFYEELATPEGEANRDKLARVKREIFDRLDQLLNQLFVVMSEKVDDSFREKFRNLVEELEKERVISRKGIKTIIENVEKGNYEMIGYLINIITTAIKQRNIFFTPIYFKLVVHPLVAAFANYFIEVLVNNYLFYKNQKHSESQERSEEKRSPLEPILSILDVDHSQPLDNTENANGGNN